MNTTFVSTRRWLAALIVAAVVAVTAAYGPVLLSEGAGMDAGTPVYACNAAGGGC